MKITYLSHSCFFIETSAHRLIIDPFLTGNPLAEVKQEDVECDFVLLTHGHGDHMGDALEIATRNDAQVISSYEVAEWLRWRGVKKTHPLGVGGGFDFPFGRVKLTPAFHSAGHPPAVEGKTAEFSYMGTAAGMLIFADGKTIYHAGDTGLTVEFELIGRRNRIDVALLPIGDNFTMGPDDAVAAAEMLKPGLTVPMHYNTFGYIKQDPAAFVKALEAVGLKGEALGIGGTIEV